ncbi:NAD(P)-binding protein [Trematosphaeria pertusa]|uniref:NAD(P)-binding protein n=1 Tax=Trematosphaeria pertusa TaxID=390896 RepID=A0A6A6J2S5_9PLEO|nr:NAD(P)-binding protein [Trematosphaeria pertusa]KAF2256210.1 NAD(P)-binding protein [Trematosphaeria pertusa]
MAIQNVALIGGTGTVGAPILEALKSSSFKLSVLNRASSKSTYPDTHVITIPDDLNVTRVAQAFKENSIDALIIAIAGSRVAESKKLIEAAFKGGVKRLIPADFGSCDSADEKTNEILPLMAGKKVIRDYLISLQDVERGTRGKMSWTSLITGHFFDYGLTCGLLKFNVAGRKAYILDGGDIKFSASNLSFIANAVVRVLEKPDETQNRILYVHGLYVTQNEVLAALEKATGNTWEKIPQSSEEELAKERPKMAAGDKEAVEEIVAVWGIVASDWKQRKGFANEMLGLREDDLEETVRRAVGKM